MQCPRCQIPNEAERKFCSACGQRLTIRCPECAFINNPDDRFCGGCGKSLSHAALAEPAVSSSDDAPRHVPDAERRQLTVMFCDLVGSTALSEQLDPEELREVVRAYQHASAEVVQKFEGHIAQYLGDGLLVYFGYPLAHEDDAQRAVHAGLGIVERVRGRRGTPRQTAALSVRVGIHTGPVVVGDIGAGPRREALALGETPNLAARLQAIADPDTVVISAATQRLVHGLFVLRDLGPQTLKGISTPVGAYRVLEESEARSRLDVAATAGLTPLVGREEEIGLLLRRWEQAADGVGQFILLGGEPGIGKSRLVQVVKNRVASVAHQRLECRCSPYYVHTPLYPVIDLLPRLFDWTREAPPEAKFAKLEQGVAQTGVVLGETVPLLAALLSLPVSTRYALPPMSPERQKQKTLEALLGLLLAMTTAKPVLLIVEDLHWVDPTTLEWLTLLLDQVPTARLLALLTARPSFASPWSARSHLIPLTLTRFARRQTETMVTKVAGGKALPAEVLQQIVAKTDGVPLFVEELTKMVLESGLLREAGDRFELAGPLPPLAIPTTLQDSLMARLDRLAQVKEVAQLGATLGRAFPYPLIRAVSTLDEATLQRELGRLVEVELLYQRGLPPQSTYTFKHALIQETAYQSLLKSTRQHYHQRIARVLVERFPDVAETRPEFVAHHYTEAGLASDAIEYWTRAGQRALQRSANLEAIGHFSKGVELLTALPASEACSRRELSLRLGLGPAFIATHGYGAAEVEHAFTRAQELCEELGEAEQGFFSLMGQWVVLLVRAEHAKARELAESGRRLAEHLQNRQLLTLAHHMVGDSLYWMGNFVTSRQVMERAINLYNPQTDRGLAARFGNDVSAVDRAYLSWNLWALGYPDQSVRRMADAVNVAKEIGHAQTIAHCVSHATGLRVHLRDPSATREWAEELIAYAQEQGFRYWAAWGLVWRGWALVQDGRADEGIAKMGEGLDRSRAAGAPICHPWSLGLLAECYASVGRIEDGLQVVRRALDAVDRTEERAPESELRRIHGELLLRRAASDAEQAEQCLHQAIEVARRQQARLYELRAAVSLSRLLQQQGKDAEARQALADIYGWFTEGFDTRDLKDAKTLLDELA